MSVKTDQEIAAEKDGMVIVVLATVVICAFVGLSDMFSTYMRGVIFAGVLFSFMVARMGRERKIGYVKAFLVSSLLSPVIGLIVVISSPRLRDEEYKDKMLQAAENGGTGGAVADQLYKLNELRKEGVLTEEEFEQQKAKVLSS